MDTPISDLIGKVISKIRQTDELIVFSMADGSEYQMFHSQDCCECVLVEDVIGDLNNLIGSPITMAEEATSQEQHGKEPADDSFLWTFYKLATVKGYVTIRWYGSSNGYYSESVTFAKTL